MNRKTPNELDQDINLKNSPNSGQIGQAGGDLIQAGRDYIQYIYNNSRNGHWGKVAIALIPLFLFLYGAREVGIKAAETFTPKSPKRSAAIALPTQSPIHKEPKQSTDSQPSKFQFPQNSCGDKSTDSNNTWYPVFINGGSLDEIQQKYCKDAINATRQTGEKAIQVASFISDTKALRFAKAVGGEVGEPRKPSPAVSPQILSNSGNNSSVPPSSDTDAQEAARQRAAQEEAEKQRAAAQEEAARQRAAQEEAARQQELARQQAEAARRQAIASSGCVVTINRPFVSLMSEPAPFSQELIRVSSGEYTISDYVTRSFAGSAQGWFEITSGGRTGWVSNDTMTVDAKTSTCP